MNDSKRAYNTYEENQRIKAAARIAKKEGTVGPIPTTVNLNNSKRTYLTYEEEQRVKESVKVYNKELERNEEEEIQMWYVILCLPDFLRDILSKSKLRFLTPIYNAIVSFLFYKLTLYLESVFNFKGNVYDILFNNSHNLSGAEIEGSIFYLIIFGLPILYTIIQIIRFGIFTITDIFRLFKRKQYPKEEIDRFYQNFQEQRDIENNELKINVEEPIKEIKSKKEELIFKTWKEHKPKGEYDELLVEVVDYLSELDEISCALVQKRFKVGISRATRILGQIEELGLTSRKFGFYWNVLITKEEWNKSNLRKEFLKPF